MQTGRALGRPQRRVVHHVADDVDAGRDAFAGEVGTGLLVGAEKQIGDGVGENAVDFFGHPTVERAHTRLDVRDRKMQLGGNQGAAAASVELVSP